MSSVQKNDMDASLPLKDNGVSPEKSVSQKRSRGHLRPASQSMAKVLVVFALVATGGVVGLYFQPPGLQALFSITGLSPGGGSAQPIAVPLTHAETLPEKRDATSRSQVVALGRIMPLNDIITLSPPFGVGDARVEEILVREGDHVIKGQVIATLDNRYQLINALEDAEANVSTEQARLAQTESLIKAEFLEAKAMLNQQITAHELAKRDLTRGRTLFDRGQIAQKEMDALNAAAGQSKDLVDRATAALSRFEGLGDGKQADINLAKSGLDRALNELLQAKRNISMSEVRAPEAGQVLSINARIGERPGSAGVTTLGDTESMQVELEVYQTDIRWLETGQVVSVRSPALGDETLYGEIVHLGLEVRRQNLVSDDPAANTDARVVPVRVTLDDRSSRLAAKYTGLQVDGRIDLASDHD